MNKKNIIKIAIISSAVLVIGIGSSIAYSYFTDSSNIVNNYTVGMAGIDLTETNYQQGVSENLVYGKIIPKNPVAHNTGNIDEYVKIEVHMPAVANVSWVDNDNNFREAAENTYVDIFKYDLNEDWLLLDEPILDTSKEEENGYAIKIYSYIYKDVLKPNKETPAIFEFITMNKITQGQIEGVNYNMPVKGYAIQAYGFNSENVKEELAHAKTEEWVPEPDEE